MSSNRAQKPAAVFTSDAPVSERAFRVRTFLARHLFGPRTKLLQTLIAGAAWLCLLGICFITLSPIGIRPDVGEPHAERFVGFAVLGLLFGAAYPRRLPLVLSVIIGTAIILELSQSFTGDRHAKLADVIFKILGAVFGSLVFVGARSLLNRYLARYGVAESSLD